MPSVHGAQRRAANTIVEVDQPVVHAGYNAIGG